MAASDVLKLILKLLVFVLVVRFLYTTIVWLGVFKKKKCEGLSYGQFLKKNFLIWDICDARGGNAGEWNHLEFQMTHYFLTKKLDDIAHDPTEKTSSDAKINCRYTVKEAADLLTRVISADYDFPTVFRFFKETKDFNCLNTKDTHPVLSGVFQEMCQRLTDFAKNNVICKCVKETETLEPGFKCCEGLKDDGNGKCGPTCTTSKPTDDLPCCPGYDNNNGTCTQCCQKPGYKANTSCSQGCCDGKSPDLNGYCPALNEWKDCADPGESPPDGYIHPCCDGQPSTSTDDGTGNVCPAALCSAGPGEKPQEGCVYPCKPGLHLDQDGHCYPPCTVGENTDITPDCDVPCKHGLKIQKNRCVPCTVGPGEKYDPENCDYPCEAGLIQDEDGYCYPPCTVGPGKKYDPENCDYPCKTGLDPDQDGHCYPKCTVGIKETYDDTCTFPCKVGLKEDKKTKSCVPCTVGPGEKYDPDCTDRCEAGLIADDTYGVCNAPCSLEPGSKPISEIICDPVCKDGQELGEDGTCPPAKKSVSFSDQDDYYY